MRTTASQDLVQGLAQWSLWGRLGWRDVIRRYRRTVIGPFWSAISLGVFVLALGSVGSGLFTYSAKDYLPFLAAGMVVWVMVSSMITESTIMFLGVGNLIRQMRVNYSILAYALVWRNAIVFFHNLSVFFVITLVLNPSLLSPVMILALPGLLLVMINAAWISLTLGIWCLRFRDLQQLITTLVQIAMFVTPIFWPQESLVGPMRIIVVDLNPLYHMIDIIRSPLLGKLPHMESYLYVCLLTAIGWTVFAFFFHRFRGRIAYWS
jgi:ABC-type polysaccharide/polyol phosphate export permease